MKKLSIISLSLLLVGLGCSTEAVNFSALARRLAPLATGVVGYVGVGTLRNKDDEWQIDGSQGVFEGSPLDLLAQEVKAVQAVKDFTIRTCFLRESSIFPSKLMAAKVDPRSGQKFILVNEALLKASPEGVKALRFFMLREAGHLAHTDLAGKRGLLTMSALHVLACGIYDRFIWEKTAAMGPLFKIGTRITAVPLLYLLSNTTAWILRKPAGQEIEGQADRYAIQHCSIDDLKKAQSFFVLLQQADKQMRQNLENMDSGVLKGLTKSLIWFNRNILDVHPPLEERIGKIKQAIKDRQQAEAEKSGQPREIVE